MEAVDEAVDVEDQAAEVEDKGAEVEDQAAEVDNQALDRLAELIEGAACVFACRFTASWARSIDVDFPGSGCL